MINELQGLLILKVAIPVPLRQLFDYLPPLEQSNVTGLPGMRVAVPFGNQKKVGIIVASAKTSDLPKAKLKRAYALLDQEPLFPTTLLDLIQWASKYYHAPLGEVFETALPSRLRKLELPTSRKKKKIEETRSQEIRSETSATHQTTLQLNSAQQQAVDAIQQSFGKFQTFLLNGVTGSGKTEVYIRVIEKALAQNLQSLVLIPEIGLTPQLLARFQERFSVPISVLNSSLSERKRFEAWEQARTGQAPIVIGTRLSAFVPLKSPGVFIVDEEHDASFKQQEGFRYHARDLLIKRASLEKCPIVLGSATPSLETLYNIENGKFQNLILPSRAGNATFPTLQILDIRHKKLEEGLSTQLIEKMHEHINNQGQILLFLNRRGYAPILMCFACGFIANCQYCDARLTIHHRLQQLQCHHCESSIPLYLECPVCQHKNLKPIGIGTERIEQALQKYFPRVSITRIDRDTISKKNTMSETIERIHKGETNILLGTQMIAKGHHFPNVTLVAILDIDPALFSLDFRSLEKIGQLITQVSGRTGRADRLGHVILQTCHPEHPLLKKLLESGYSNFANALLKERQLINLPPYSHQALIRAEAKILDRALDFLAFIKHDFFPKTSLSTFKVLGPIPAPMEKRLGKYHGQLLLQANQRAFLQKLLQNIVPKIEAYAVNKKIRWSLDVDPIDLY